jgi:hypothetical protein
MSTTIQQIVNSTTTDIMNQIGVNHPILLDYCNRINYNILRNTKWDFLLSDVQSFITRQGVTSYWIGATGQGPQGTFDTGLDITDIKWVQHGSVYDRSNFLNLGSVAAMPVSAVLNYTDGSSRPGRPCVYRNNVDTPFILNIYPAPDQQNNQAPQPEPILTSVTSGVGSVIALTPQNPGINYVIGDTVTLVQGAASSATAQVTALVEENGIAAVTLVTGGSGYKTGLVAVSGGTGTEATFNIVATAGNVLPARTYNLVATLVDALGNESTAPDYTTPLYIPAGSLAVGYSPSLLVPTNDAGVPYSSWNIYASATNTVPQNATKQNSVAIPIGTNWTEPNTGLTTSGVGPPSYNACSTYNGYIIQFRYYETETPITTFTQTLQIPDRYTDVMVAGVNWLALKFLNRAPEAQEWYVTYHTGLVSMVRDRNQANRFADYISPDPSSVGGFLPTIETIDLSLLTP